MTQKKAQPNFLKLSIYNIGYLNLRIRPQSSPPILPYSRQEHIVSRALLYRLCVLRENVFETMVQNKYCNYKYLHMCNIGKKRSPASRSPAAAKYFYIIDSRHLAQKTSVSMVVIQRIKRKPLLERRGSIS